MSQRQLFTGIAVVAAIAVVALFFIANPFASENPLNPIQSSEPAGSASLVVQDEVVGTGAAAQPGDTVTVNYTGKLANGTVFDTSVGKNPYMFTLGNGDVIAGWDQGIAGMKVGGKRILIVPPSLGYGGTDYGPIPANSTLTFEVELLKITPAASAGPALEGPAVQ